MAGVKKQTIRSLSEEVDLLKEQLKEMDYLKQKVMEMEKDHASEMTLMKKEIKELEGILKNLVVNKEPPVNNSDENSLIKCRKCGEIFGCKKKLRKHLIEKHPRKIECKSCDAIFAQNFELEVHMKTEHKQTPEYNCEVCNKKFILRWRLEKHRNNHADHDKKKCHYFNNYKSCPFEQIGCMFAHEVSGMCKFDRICLNRLCSYQHSNLKNPPIENDRQEFEDTEEKKFECEYCDFKMDSYNEFLDHINTNHLDSEDENDEPGD